MTPARPCQSGGVRPIIQTGRSRSGAGAALRRRREPNFLSPVVAVNRAAAVARVEGAAAGLALLEAAGAEGGFEGFEPYWVATADLCAKVGAREAARRAYALAIGLQADPAARAFLIERLAALA